MSFAFKRVERTIIIEEGSTHIPARAFERGNDTQVVIPDSVTSIGERAFYLNNLSSVSGGDSVERIGDEAFYENNLQQIDFPSLRKIGRRAFAFNQFINLEIPSVERIDLFKPNRNWGGFGRESIGEMCGTGIDTAGAFEGNKIRKAILHPALENAHRALGTQIADPPPEDGADPWAFIAAMSIYPCGSIIEPTIKQNPSEIFGTSGDDEIFGNLWADNIFGDFGNDTINGDKGNDSIKGQQGDDLLKGKDGDDSLVGGEGDDTLNGGNGDDILIGGIGDNVYKGGEGSDTFEIAAYGTHSIKDYNAGEGDKIRLNTDKIKSIINHESVISINYNENGLLKVYGSTVLDVLSNTEFA